MKVAKLIGRNLKEARHYKNLSQTQLAKMLNMTQQQYSRFETGIFELNYEQILAVCKILEITPNEFFDVK